jgi:hypothetical protein
VNRNTASFVAALSIIGATLTLACQKPAPAPPSATPSQATASQVGYATLSVIIYAGAPTTPAPWGGGPAYGAANSPTGPPNMHEISMPVPAGAKVIGAWYTPEDRVDQLSQFAEVNLAVADATHVQLQIKSQQDSKSFMRIRLHCLYSS